VCQDSITGFAWCASLTRLALRTRTPFALYLSFSFTVTSWTEPCSRTALYPLPIPFPRDMFTAIEARPVGRRGEKRRRAAVVHMRAMSVIALALNHVHEEVPHRPDRLALWRHPDDAQLQVIERLSAFISAWCRFRAGYELGCSRRGPALLEELDKVIAVFKVLRRMSLLTM
jgi:hypothetical protein